LLYMNPPYSDRDPEYDRLEARWLARLHDALCFKGVLVFVIPTSALGACATILGHHFERVECYRFPSPMFEKYKQVVVVATRGISSPTVRSDIVVRVNEWANEPDAIPVLPSEPLRLRAKVPSFQEIDESFGSTGMRPGFSSIAIAKMDILSVARHATPWRIRDRKGNEFVIGGMLPESGGAALREPRIDTVMPLHAGHITAALALDLYNGVRLEPNDPSIGLPIVLLKAVFRREWMTVERRHNEKNVLVGERQRERPKITVTVLDVERGKVHRLRSSVERTQHQSLEHMTVADFIAAYGKAMVRVVHERCPALYDPARDGILPEFADLDEPLFRAQRELVCGNIRLMQAQGTTLILGQTGTGKTRISLSLKKSLRVHRTLIVVPPHLRNDPWELEAKAAWKGLRVAQIEDIDDADRFAADTSPEPVIGILSATSGKLSHGWAGIGSTAKESLPRHVGPANKKVSLEIERHRTAFLAPKPKREITHYAVLPETRCPSCGADVKESPEALARARHKDGAGYCKAKPWQPNPRHERLGLLAMRLAELLLPVAPTSEFVATIARMSPGRDRLVSHWGYGPKAVAAELPGSAADRVDAERARRERAWEHIQSALKELVWSLSEPLREGRELAYEGAIGRLLVAIDDDDLTAKIALSIYQQALKYADETPAKRSFTELAQMRESARRILLAMVPWREAQSVIAYELERMWSGEEDAWTVWRGKVADLAGDSESAGYRAKYMDQATGSGDTVKHYGFYRGDVAAATDALEKLIQGRLIVQGKPCGEPLFQAIPSPRKVALSQYIAKHYWDKIGLVIVDEIHRCQDKDSAEAAAIEQWRGKPIIGLTGSLSNGYVLSTFFILHLLSPSFRREFTRDDEMGCVRRHGYVAQFVEYKDKKTREIVAFGSQSDRVERKTKILGGAPGMMPSLMRHVLPSSTFIHLDDLDLDLPPLKEQVIWVDPGQKLGETVKNARKLLLARIKADKRTPRHGALFGAMAGEWASADLAGIGNEPDGMYRIRYPESFGSEVVAELHVSGILPKEQVLIDEVRAELAAGNNIIICAWHSQSTTILHRIKELVETHVGETCVVLDSHKVKATARDEWIQKEIVKKNRRIMTANPAAIGTGFNCLVHFCTVIFYQPPSYNPKDVRQLMGRVRRPRQTRAQQIKWLLYKGTSQENVHTLLGWKRAASVALEGLDDTAELESIGVDTTHEITAYHMGQQLCRMALEQEGETVDVE
jgi:hypothetical protein